MTRYCPSCGKPNTEQADKCASCGAELSPHQHESGESAGQGQGGAPQRSAGKFKGTMMMGAASPPGPPEDEQGGEPSDSAESGESPDAGSTGGPRQAGRSGPQQGPEQGGQADNLAFKKTMLGPGGGGPAPPEGAPGSGASGGAESSEGAPGSSGGASESAQGPAKRGPRGTMVAGTPPAGPEPSAGQGASGDQGPPSGTNQGGAAGKGPRGTVVAAGPPAGPAASSGGQGDASAGESRTGASSGGSGAVSGATVPAAGPPAGAGAAAGGASAGETADPETVSPPQTGDNQRKKMILWIALGCLGLALVGCLIGGIVAYSCAQPGVAKMEKASQELASRAELLLALDGIQGTCERDGSGKAAKQYFHPDVFDRLKSRACNLDKKTVSAFADVQNSSSEVLTQTDAASKATELGLDPSSCQRYSAGEAYVIACDTTDKLRVIDMGNLGASP